MWNRHFSLTSYIIFLLMFVQAIGNANAQVKAYTEEWPPYNLTEGSEFKGIATDILRAACDLSKINCEIQIVPWLRAYKTTQETPNSLIYTIIRAAARENEFIWIGPILPRTTWIYVRSDVAAKFQDLKQLNGIRIGVTRGAAFIDEILAAGIPNANLRYFNSNDDLMRTLKAGAIDACSNTEIGMAYNQKIYEMPSNSIAKLRKLSDGPELYFGMNLKSDQALAKKLQTAVDSLKNEGKIQAIVNKYTNQ
jgi:polar amino acid transport system substrate-binding protein